MAKNSKSLGNNCDVLDERNADHVKQSSPNDIKKKDLTDNPASKLGLDGAREKYTRDARKPKGGSVKAI